jgi:triosephosphate isomerase (TIM)
MARRMLVAGNWKMNGLAFSAEDAAAINAAAAQTPTVDVAICPPATLITSVRASLPHVLAGAQDCHALPSGAFTGWLSAEMVRAAGAELVIVGHSERRAMAVETDADVRGKALAALAGNLVPIICVGESEAVRERGEHIEVVLAQLDGSLPDESDARVVVAYEPIWAIGTGKTASPDDVAEMHAAIRGRLVARFGDAGSWMRILYGGSVNAGNAEQLFAVPDVDGALVGGASLKAESFVPIITAAVGTAP